MSWQAIESHQRQRVFFQRSLARGRLASTFLLVGPVGVGKRTFALELAKTLLCQTMSADRFEACDRCASCVQCAAGSHPDVILIAKPEDKSFIPLAALLGDDDRRMRAGFCHDIALKPFMGGRKIAILDDADYLNEEGANALLKTLEEPPPNCVLMLLSASLDRQLPTIRSRCQIVRFGPLSDETVARLALEQGLVGDEQSAYQLAALSEGSLQRATELADPEVRQFRIELLGHLAKADIDSVAMSRRLSEFVDEAGKEASARRTRSRQVISFAAEFLRQRLRTSTGSAAPGDREMAVAVAAARPSGLDPEQLAAAIDRCLDALAQVDRNANQTTLLECWMDDLGRLLTTKR